MSPPGAEMIYHPDIALMRLLIASGDVIGIAAGEQFRVSVAHVRIVLETGIIVQIEKIIVACIRQDAERYCCQSHL